ncbi:MAG TPA: winged helix-turn-helix domain-containing protein [Candidatus Acidoferrales bacterium]|nr:winged helix-turn-helix domain-containing protein [Candidatus Acidoferrales bacterium]
MQKSPETTFVFGPYESRGVTRELFKHGVRLKIRPQPLQVLNYLLSRAGNVVTREELRQELWSAEIFVDFEHGLNNSVKELRAVLGDSAAEPRYIQTLPRLGYRFVAAVEITGSGASPVSLPTIEGPNLAPAGRSSDFAVPRGLPVERAEESSTLRRWPALLAVCLALVLGLVFYFRWSSSRARRPAVTGRTMVAVLPFQNLTGDPGQEYFSDGLTEEMISQLGRIDPQRVGVIARTSVMHYKNNPEQLNQIGRELGVQYVLEGSVRRGSNKVRITAQLIQTKDQSHVWAHQYDREENNLLGLQSEIAQEISDAIQLTLGEHKPVEANPPADSHAPKSYAAYDLYLQGRYFWNKRTPQGLQQAVECFEQAVGKDPEYARAYAGLADSLALMSAYGVAPPGEVIPKARTAALKALSLDEKLAEAHASLALIAQSYDWEWQTAEKEYRRAVELDPNYATGHHWYAEHLALRGRFDEAFVEIERARQLDPLSLIIQVDNGAILFFARQYDRAIEQLQAVLKVEADFPRARILNFAYAQQGRFADALAGIEDWRRTSDTYWTLTEEGYVYGRAGQSAQARRAVDKLQSINGRAPVDPLAFVPPYVGLGDKDQAFAWLDKSIAVHSPGLTALKVDPVYDPLRSDPRFEVILRRIGLAQ